MKWGLNRPSRGWCQTSKFGCWPKKMLLSYKFGEGAILCYRWFSRDSSLFVVLVHVYLLLIFQNDVAQWNVGHFHHGFSYPFWTPSWGLAFPDSWCIADRGSCSQKAHGDCWLCWPSWSCRILIKQKSNRSFLLLKSHTCCCPTSSWFAAHRNLVFFPF